MLQSILECSWVHLLSSPTLVYTAVDLHFRARPMVYTSNAFESWENSWKSLILFIRIQLFDINGKSQWRKTNFNVNFHREPLRNNFPVLLILQLSMDANALLKTGRPRPLLEFLDVQGYCISMSKEKKHFWGGLCSNYEKIISIRRQYLLWVKFCISMISTQCHMKNWHYLWILRSLGRC